MEGGGDLPGVSALVPGHGRRRRGRPRGRGASAAPPPRPGRGRPVDQPRLPLAHGRLRLRRGRLLRHRPPLRRAGRLRPAARRGPRVRDEGAAGPRAQPHLRPAPLVPGKPLVAGEPEARLVHLARPRPRRRPAQQLDQRLRRLLVGVGRPHRPVLPPRLPARAARPELARAGGARGHARRAALLVRPRGGRLPHRRPVARDQGRPVPRQPAQARPRAPHGRAVRPGAALQHRPARGARGGRRAARGGRRLRRRPGADRRDLPAAGPAGDLVRLGGAAGGAALQLRPDQRGVGRPHDPRPRRRVRGRPAAGRLAQLGAGQPRPAAHRHPRRRRRRRGWPPCCC